MNLYTYSCQSPIGPKCESHLEWRQSIEDINENMKTPLTVMVQGLKECFQQWYGHQQKCGGKKKKLFQRWWAAKPTMTGKLTKSEAHKLSKSTMFLLIQPYIYCIKYISVKYNGSNYYPMFVSKNIFNEVINEIKWDQHENFKSCIQIIEYSLINKW